MFSRVYSIKNKLIISNVLVLLVVCAIYSVYNYYQMVNQLEIQAKNTLEYHVESVTARVELAYEGMCDLILNTYAEGGMSLKNASERSTISKKKALEMAENLNLLCNNSSLRDYIAKLMIVYSPEQFIQRGYIYGSIDDVQQILDSDWYQDESSKKISDYSLRVVEAPFFEGDEEKIIPMQIAGFSTSFVFMGVSLKLFQNILMEYDNENGIIIFTEDGDVVACENISEENCTYMWQSWQENVLGNQLFFEDNVNGQRWLVYGNQNSKSGLVICEMLDGTALTNERMMTMQMMAALFIAAIIIGMLTFRILSNQIDKPIQRLICRINVVSQGNFERDITIEGKDEFGKIGIVINQMSERIKSLMYEAIRNEQEKKDMEMRMLQAQINPHFLYNTLDSIKWVAAVQENTGIVKVVTALTRLLRNMAKGFNEKVTLRQELDFLDDYIVVERFKYVELFDVEIEVEEECLYQAKIVKLTLQPIVENAILNGIEPARRIGMIWIKARREGKKLVITVKDNGIGISKEKLDTIFNEDEENGNRSLNGIGLKNVNRRLKLVYGESSGVSVCSTPGKGTEVRIQLPLEFDKETECTEL